MNMPPPNAGEQLWLELPPISATAPRRLIAFLHGAGSAPEAFAPVAVAWQLKFPGATTVVLQGLEPAVFPGTRNWFDGTGDAQARATAARRAASIVAERIAALQSQFSLAAAQTVLVGFSQGATLALEIARLRPGRVGIVVAYAGRLARPVLPGERIEPTIHLIHGEFDSWVPTVHATRALAGLSAVAADVTLDIVEDGIHSVGQDMVILGTTRVMQTLFRGRRPPPIRRSDRALH